MKVYVTKYALTKGIQRYGRATWKVESMIRVDIKDQFFGRYFDKPDWHTTYAEAVARAEQMRVDKLNSLRKQLAKLEALTFPESEEPTKRERRTREAKKGGA